MYSNQLYTLVYCRLPGLESSNNNKVQEDAMYDEMMTALLRIVLSPVCPVLDSASESDSTQLQSGLWEYVRTPAPSSAEQTASSTCWANLLKWKAFTRKNRQKILAEFA